MQSYVWQSLGVMQGQYTTLPFFIKKINVAFPYKTKAYNLCLLLVHCIKH